MRCIAPGEVGQLLRRGARRERTRSPRPIAIHGTALGSLPFGHDPRRQPSQPAIPGPRGHRSRLGARPGRPGAGPVRRALGRGSAAATHRARAPVTIERPADPTCGDFASNIALRLAKPYRRAPLEIAGAIAAHVATTATDPASPIASVEVAPPGFLNIRVADGALAATAQHDPARPGHLGPRQPPRIRSTSTSSSSRPTPPGRSTSATPAAPSPATCSAASSRPPATRSSASTTSTTSAARSRTWAHRSWPSARAARSPRTATTATTSTTWPASCRPQVLAEAEKSGEDPAWAVGRWASEQVRAGIEASLEHLGCHFDVWRSESTLHNDGWVAQAVDRLRGRRRRLRGGRRGRLPIDQVRRRQGSGDPALDRRRRARPTSRPTSATSSRSSAAATSASSSSGARTITATSPGSRPRRSRSASTATTSR